MKRHILALALLAATTAQANGWLPIGASANGNEHFIADEVVADRSGAIAFAAVRTADGRTYRYLLSVKAAACRQGFGYMVSSDLEGHNQRRDGEFMLGQHQTMNDTMAEHLCNRIPTTTARKSK